MMDINATGVTCVSEDVLRDTGDPGAAAVCVWAEALVSGVLLEL